MSNTETTVTKNGFKIVPINDVDECTEGDFLIVKEGCNVETHVAPFSEPSVIEEDGSLFVATKAKGYLNPNDMVQILDCIAFEENNKIYPYIIRLLHNAEVVYIIHNDFMNTKTTLANFVRVVE